VRLRDAESTPIGTELDSGWKPKRAPSLRAITGPEWTSALWKFGSGAMWGFFVGPVVGALVVPVVSPSYDEWVFRVLGLSMMLGGLIGVLGRWE